jgi:hypothetical protein
VIAAAARAAPGSTRPAGGATICRLRLPLCRQVRSRCSEAPAAARTGGGAGPGRANFGSYDRLLGRNPRTAREPGAENASHEGADFFPLATVIPCPLKIRGDFQSEGPRKSVPSGVSITNGVGNEKPSMISQKWGMIMDGEAELYGARLRANWEPIS